MDCRDVERQMDACLDRELPPSQRRELEAHLQGCSACTRQWGGLVNVLTRPAAVEVPAGLRDRIVAAVAEQNRSGGNPRLVQDRGVKPRGSFEAAQSTPTRRVWIWPSAIAACLTFFFMGWVASRLWTPSQSMVVVEKKPPAIETTVVLSPWLVSTLARASMMPGPMSPAVVLAQGIVPEMMTAVPDEQPVPRIYERPRASASQPAGAANPTLPLVPLIPRYLGA